MEESLFIGDLRLQRQARHQRPRRKLWRGKADVLQNASADGSARNDFVGVPNARPFVGIGDGGISRRHPPQPPAVGESARREGRVERRGKDLQFMIITRSPLRISLGGGGTDLPSYYMEHGGFLIAAAIDKYVYITVHDTFVPELIVKYSKMERVKSPD